MPSNGLFVNIRVLFVSFVVKGFFRLIFFFHRRDTFANLPLQLIHDLVFRYFVGRFALDIEQVG